MKMNTSKLTGFALDWAVARCEGWDNLRRDIHLSWQGGLNDLVMDGPPGNGVSLWALNFSSDWALGGPIIEREKLGLSFEKVEEWEAWAYAGVCRSGPTPLIAAMRCYVASKLGDEVDIPAVLMIATA